MTQQFDTAKAFADFICQVRYGRSFVMKTNKMCGSERIDLVVSDVIRYASRWTLEDGGIQFEYNQAAYGLRWTLDSGRVNGQTVLAIREMNVRQLCELIHELMTYHYDISLYASYLMRKFTTVA